MKRLRVTGPMKKAADAAKAKKVRGVFSVPNTTVIEEKKHPVTGETLVWNGRPVLQGRHMTVSVRPTRLTTRALSVRNSPDASDAAAAQRCDWRVGSAAARARP
jgi:hypothetical protein